MELTEKVDVKVNCKNAKPLSTEDKVKQQNCICQLAKTAREKMPKDSKSICVVAAHLMKNAHIYYSEKDVMESSKEKELKNPEMEPKEKCKHLNQKLWSIRFLKR